MNVNAAGTIASLRSSLERYPVSEHPVEHATVQFNLGLALAEAPDGDRDQHLKAAIVAYAQALNVFDIEGFPVERARVLNALGAAERDLGMGVVARDRFEEAAACAITASANAELGSANNNLGLALVDLGDINGAITAYDEALAAFADHPRQLATTLLNRGLAHSARGDVESLQLAIADFDRALETVSVESAPYVYATAHQSRAVALMGLPDDRQANLSAAIRSLESALNVFIRSSYPYQHALVRYNLALSFFELAEGDPTGLRRSLASYEEAASLFDPRIHRDEWLETTAGLGKVIEALDRAGHPGTRSEHFARLLGASSRPERLQLLRYRLRWLLTLREPFRAEALQALDEAIVQLSPDQLIAVSVGWLEVLMEQPQDQLQAGLRSRQTVHSKLSGPRLQAATAAIERALGELEVIQRVRVRDMLIELGYQRPDSM